MASYKTIADLSTGKYVEKGSRFIASAQHVLTEKEAIEFIESIRKEHHKARHVCFAYTIGTKNPKERINDDGEPAHTAGQPIMNQIKKHALSYIVIAVVRYFGGVLLGKGGLIQAYGSAAAEAIQSGKIINKTELITLNAKFHVTHYTSVMELVKKYKLIITNENYEGENCCIQLLCEPENENNMIKIISDLGTI
jgi:uncharacterized YigZ family protein